MTIDLDALERSIAEGAYLREQGMAPYAQSTLDYAATMIERGAHRDRREEG